MDNPPFFLLWVEIKVYEPERKFISGYRLKPLLPDKNCVSASRLRKTIVTLLEKSRAWAEKFFSAQ